MISFITTFSSLQTVPVFGPAMRAPRSRDTIRLPKRFSGTSPTTIFCASPSTIAVLPTPGSPITTRGLFFIRPARVSRKHALQSHPPCRLQDPACLLLPSVSDPAECYQGQALRSVFLLQYAPAAHRNLLQAALQPEGLLRGFRSVLPAIPSSSRRMPSRRCSLPI